MLSCHVIMQLLFQLSNLIIALTIMFHTASVVLGAEHVQQAYDDASGNDKDRTL